MKRFISTAAALAAAMMITVSATAANIPMKRLGSSAEYASSAQLSTACLLTDRTVKNTLVVKSGEAFIVPSGKNLVLTRGCKVKGTLYIENGGSVTVKGGTILISGSVINNGTLSIGSKAKLDVRDGALLYTAYNGTFKSKTIDIDIADEANLFCLGDDDVKNCSCDTLIRLVPLIDSAKTVTTGIGDEVLSSEDMDVNEALNMLKADYSCAEEVPIGNSTKLVLESEIDADENTSILEVSFVNGRIAQIGKAPMRYVLNTAGMRDDVTVYSEGLAGKWNKKWNSIGADDAMVTPAISLYTYQMGDDWLAVMVYPSYKSYAAVCYRLSGGKIKELGSVVPCGLDFEVLRKGSDYILHTTAEVPFTAGPNAETATDVIDSFYKVGKKSMKLLGSLEYDSLGNWAVLEGQSYDKITEEEYNRLMAALTDGYSSADKKTLDVPALEFRKSYGNFMNYIADCLTTP